MKYLNNSRGYTLLLTVAVIVLFTVLGLSLLTLTSNGLTKNETRQDNIQAKDLAEKGVDYLQREIELILNKKLKEDKQDYRLNIPNIFNTTFITDADAQYFCTTDLKSGVQISTDNKDYTYACIEKPTSEIDSNYLVNETTRAVRIRSTGNVNGKNFTYYSTVEFSFSSVPKQLSYAISTNKQGDLYFFGGTDVTGDIKVAGDLLVSDSAFWVSPDNPTWIKSTYPKLMSSRVNGVSNILLNEGSTENGINVAAKKVYKITTNPGNVSNLLAGASENTKKRFATEISLDQTEDIQNLFLHSETPIVQGIADSANNFPQKPNIIKTEPLQDDQVKILESITEISGKQGNEVIKKQNGLRINSSGNHSLPEHANAMYINGNVNISPSNTSNLNVNLSGNYYVNGNLYIGHTNLNANAIFYVKGTTHIEYSTIKKLQNNGTLFIFSENSIKINNISEGSVEADSSEIDGFFYSNNNFLMYGVGSNTRITGGISAKNAVFSSLRGNSYDKGDLTNSIPNACKIEYIISPEDTMFLNNPEITKEWVEQVNKLRNKTSGSPRWTNVTNNDPFSYSSINPNWIEEIYNYVFLQEKYSGNTSTLSLSEWDYVIRLINNHYSIPFKSSASSLVSDTEQLSKITDKLDFLLSQWDTSTVKNAYKKFSYEDDGSWWSSTVKIAEYDETKWEKTKEDLNILLHYLTIITDNPISIPSYCFDYYEDAKNRSDRHQGDSLHLQLRSNSRIKVFYNHDLINQFIENRAYEHININDIEVMTPVVKKIEWD